MNHRIYVDSVLRIINVVFFGLIGLLTLNLVVNYGQKMNLKKAVNKDQLYFIKNSFNGLRDYGGHLRTSN